VLNRSLCCVLGSAILGAVACAAEATDDYGGYDDGNLQPGNGSGDATGGASSGDGDPSSGTGNSSSTGSGGETGTDGTGGAGGAEDSGSDSLCLSNLEPNLVLHPDGWVGCDPKKTTDNPMGLQGAFYNYGDGSSCALPKPACGAEGCCISGSTSVDTTFAKWGCGIGLELNSTGGTTPVKSPYVGPVKCFDIALSGDSGGNKVRIGYTQAPDMTNKIAPHQEISAVVGSWSGKVCFNEVICPTWATTCSTSTTGYHDLQVQVVGAEKAAAYNLCLTKVVPLDDSGSYVPPDTLNNIGSTCNTTLGQDYLSGGAYRVQNNVHGGGGSQCISAKQGGDLVAFTVTSVSHNVAGGGQPAAYPSIVRGWHWGNWTSGSGMPKVISNIGSATSSWSFRVPTSGRWNAAYDLWLHPGSPTGNPDGGVELMVWLNRKDAYPLGGKSTTVNISGASWDVHLGTVNTWGYIAYVRTSNVTTATVDLKAFINDAVSRTAAQSNWNLLSIQAGFEIWEASGSNLFETTAFSATVN
jgi:hypothetical protein